MYINYIAGLWERKANISAVLNCPSWSVAHQIYKCSKVLTTTTCLSEDVLASLKNGHWADMYMTVSVYNNNNNNNHIIGICSSDDLKNDGEFDCYGSFFSNLKRSGVNETAMLMCVCVCVKLNKEMMVIQKCLGEWVSQIGKLEQFTETKICFYKTKCTFFPSPRAHKIPDGRLDLPDPTALLLLLFVNYQGWKMEMCMTLLEREQSVKFL